MTDRLTIAEKLAYDRAMGYVSIAGSGKRNDEPVSTVSSRGPPSPRKQ